jgi:hypothetical protein
MIQFDKNLIHYILARNRVLVTESTSHREVGDRCLGGFCGETAPQMEIRLIITQGAIVSFLQA